MIDKIDSDTYYYEINGLNKYAGQIQGNKIILWMDVMSKHHPKSDESSYTELDYSLAHGIKLTEISPIDPELIGGYIWSKNKWIVQEKKVSLYDSYNIELAKVLVLREEAFRTIADPIKFSIEEEAIRSNTTADYTEWLKAKDHVRDLYPKPVKPSN